MNVNKDFLMAIPTYEGGGAWEWSPDKRLLKAGLQGREILSIIRANKFFFSKFRLGF